MSNFITSAVSSVVNGYLKFPNLSLFFGSLGGTELGCEVSPDSGGVAAVFPEPPPALSIDLSPPGSIEFAFASLPACLLCCFIEFFNLDFGSCNAFLSAAVAVDSVFSLTILPSLSEVDSEIFTALFPFASTL